MRGGPNYIILRTRVISRSRVPDWPNDVIFVLTREDWRSSNAGVHVHVRMSISPLRKFANGWMDASASSYGDTWSKRECWVVEPVSRFSVSLSLSLSLFFTSLLSVYVYPFLTLLSWRPFPRFTLRFRNSLESHGFRTLQSTSLPPLHFIAETAFAIVSYRQKGNASAFSRGQERAPGRMIRVAGIRASSSINGAVADLFVFFFFFLSFPGELNFLQLRGMRYYFHYRPVTISRRGSCPFSFSFDLIYYAHITVLLYLGEFITYSARSAPLCFRNAPT